MKGIPPATLEAQHMIEFSRLARETRVRTDGFRSHHSQNFSFYYQPGKDAVLPLYAAEALEIDLKQRA